MSFPNVFFNHAASKLAYKCVSGYHVWSQPLVDVPVAAVQPVYPRVIRLMKPEQEQMAASFHHSKAAYH